MHGIFKLRVDMDNMLLRSDFKYIFLNGFVRHIPCWTIRKCFYKLFGMSISDDSRIGIGTIIVAPKKIALGARSIINSYCFIDGSGGLIIEQDVSISSCSKILSATHDTSSDFFEYITHPIIIRRNAWIGSGAIILDNSELKEFTVIGAGGVFKGVSEEKGIYVGNPAKKIKTRLLDKNYPIDFHPYFR